MLADMLRARLARLRDREQSNLAVARFIDSRRRAEHVDQYASNARIAATALQLAELQALPQQHQILIHRR